MAWHWRLRGQGAEPGQSGPFDDREAAEAWIATAWEDLADAGHDEAELVDDEGRVAYRMGLGPV